MNVLRGRASTRRADREVTARMLARADEKSVSSVRVWTPHRLIAFGRRDANAPGYKRAAALATARGFDPVDRSVGGRAVAYTGRTVSFAVAIPSANPRIGIEDRYETASHAVREALSDLGADVSDGEPASAFCPGDHSVRVSGGGKIAGLAQRVRADSALVAGCLIVSTDDAAEIAKVLAPIYDVLDVPFDPTAVGSVSDAGGPDDPELVGRHLENALAAATWDGDGSTADGDVPTDGRERRIEFVGGEETR
ncbi:lipoate--protein ligase family protein [Halorubrum sp. DTA98]|uniref:lipoate--protein ligase family protein n=1 Tax=Halorubrum sp. DTA98 TaxID=3402163 RepID=UPI003AAEA9D7